MLRYRDFEITKEVFVPKDLGSRHEKRMSQFNKSIFDIKEKTEDLIKAYEYVEKSKETLRNYYDSLRKLDSDTLISQIDNLKTCIYFVKSLKINDLGFTYDLFQRYLDKAIDLMSMREYSFEIDPSHLGPNKSLILKHQGKELHLNCVNKKDGGSQILLVDLIGSMTLMDVGGEKTFYGHWAPTNPIVFWFKCSPEDFKIIYDLFAMDKRFRITRKGKSDHYVIENFS